MLERKFAFMAKSLCSCVKKRNMTMHPSNTVISENDKRPYMRNMRLRVSFLISFNPFSYKVRVQEIALSRVFWLSTAELSETCPRMSVLSEPSVIE